MYIRLVAVEVGVKEFRANLSAYLDRVTAGEDVVVTERGTPVAHVTRPGGAQARRAELIARGTLTPAKRPWQGITSEPIPVTGSVVELLLRDRDSRG